MADVKVIDKDGGWYVNRAQFRFSHPTRPGVFFEPGLPTKYKPEDKDWIGGQSLIVKVDDPFAPAPATVKSETPLKDAANTVKK